MKTKPMPIEVAHLELSQLQKSLGLLAGWETLNYHKESDLCWVSNRTLSRVVYLDASKYGPIVEVLNEVADLEEHMSVFIGHNYTD